MKKHLIRLSFFLSTFLLIYLLMPLTATAGTVVLQKISGDKQSAVTGTRLRRQLVVRLRDNEGKNLQNHRIAFSITQGSGSLSSTSVVTNNEGKAKTTLTLGNIAGTVKVKAEFEENPAEPSVSFTATAVTPASFVAGDSTSRSVAENEPIGTNVGAPLSVNSVEGVHHYFVYATSNDPDRSWFSVGVNSGQLKTKQVFDYETKNSYAIAVDLYLRVDDADFLVDSIIVTINVEDVEETPTNTAPSFTGTRTTRSITERIPSNQNIGHPVSATDADNDTLTYTLGGTNALAFSIDSSTGQLKTKIPLDYETKNQYTVTVTVSDGSLSDTITVTINVTERDRDTKRGPAFTEGKNTTRSVAENTPSGVNLGVPFLATDPDGDTLTYSLGGTDKASFSFDSSTSQLKTKAPLDYETKNRYTVTISAFDGYLTGIITVTITVTDVFEPTTNSPPAFTEGDSAARAIAENSSTGLGFGAPVSATDPDGDTLTYSLGGTDAASFSIYSITGYLRTKAQLDYETKNQYTVTVFVSDGNGGSDSITITINVTDIYEPWTNDSPVFTEGSKTSRAIVEDTPPNTNIGAPVSATDADNDTLIYTLGGTDKASFSIDSGTGQLKTKAPLDYETKNRYTVRVFVSDGNGGSDNITVTITLWAAWVTNSYPSFTEGDNTTRAIAENTPPGVNIGAPVSATDPDGDTLTYSWASTNAEKFFSLDSSTGQLRTKIPLVKKRYSVAVAVIDGKFGSDTIRVIVNVTEAEQIGFSELMIAASAEPDSLPQWIELYNNSAETVNLKNWDLEIEARDDNSAHRHVVITFEELRVPPNQTALIVTREGRNSGDFPEDRVYNVFTHHGDEFEQNTRVLGLAGFSLKLSDPDGVVSDVAGNLDGDSATTDEPAWELPAVTTEDGARTSLLRQYNPKKDKPRDGTVSTNWVRASERELRFNTYWGEITDKGNPGHRLKHRPLPVTLSHFRAEKTDTGVVINWTTESELENAGFYILRSETKAGEFKVVNPSMIQGAGTTGERNEYAWTDTTAKPDVVYYYRIEDISFTGVRQTLATKMLQGIFSAKNRWTTQWGKLKSRPR